MTTSAPFPRNGHRPVRDRGRGERPPDDGLVERERERLAALDRYAILDTPPEPKFDNIVRLASSMCGTPIALLSLVDKDRQWFKAEVGLGTSQTSLDASICALLLLQRGLTVIPDLTADARFSCNPLVTGEPMLRFYAGARLETREGVALGSLCVLDIAPRSEGLGDWQRHGLSTLAAEVMDSLELRRVLIEREIAERNRREHAEMRERIVIESVSDGVFALDDRWRFTLFNRAAQEILGRREEEVLGRKLTEVFPTTAGSLLEQRFGEAMAHRREMRFEARSATRPDRFLEFRAAPMESGIAVSFTDVTERKMADAALRTSEERFRQFGEASSDILWIRDVETLGFEYLSPAFETIHDVRREQVMGEGGLARWTELIVPQDREQGVAHIRRARAGERTTAEYRISRPDGQVRWLVDTSFPLADETGRVRRIGGIGHDATEAKLLREHERLLLAELQHRVRNSLSVVRSIARRTARHSRTVEDYQMHLDGRLASFARAQAYVIRSPGRSIDLRSLITDELLAHQGQEGEQVRLDGPDVRLEPRTTETLGLAVHELATNAVKYGALSVDGGTIEIVWSIEGGADEASLRIDWVEKVPGGIDEPGPGGFGTELLERALPYELGVVASSVFAPEGLRCTLTLPLAPPTAVPGPIG